MYKNIKKISSVTSAINREMNGCIDKYNHSLTRTYLIASRKDNRELL